jgi:hypothetical protein
MIKAGVIDEADNECEKDVRKAEGNQKLLRDAQENIPQPEHVLAKDKVYTPSLRVLAVNNGKFQENFRLKLKSYAALSQSDSVFCFAGSRCIAFIYSHFLISQLQRSIFYHNI